MNEKERRLTELVESLTADCRDLRAQVSVLRRDLAEALEEIVWLKARAGR